jgi:hypothetical protein
MVHVSALDGKIDELYQLPLAEFTAARNALAKTLSGDEARAVKRLAKPTVVPWAINQLYARARFVYDRLLESGEALREAQLAALEGRGTAKPKRSEHPTDLRRLSEAHRKALAEAVDRAAALAASHGSRPDVEPLSRMLEALSLSATRPDHPGRFTELVQPAGFEALTGVTLAEPAAPASPKLRAPTNRSEGGPKPTTPERREGRYADEAAAERKRTRQSEAERKRAAARVMAAQRVLERAQTAEVKARLAYERAQRAVKAAELSLERLRKDAQPLIR